MDPRGTVGRNNKEDHYTLLHTKYKSLVVSKKKIFLCFSHCKSMEANDPRGQPIFDPRDMVGRILKRTTTHCYIQNTRGPMVL